MLSLVIRHFVSSPHILWVCWTFVVTFGHVNPIPLPTGWWNAVLLLQMPARGQSLSAFLWQRKGMVSWLVYYDSLTWDLNLERLTTDVLNS